MFGWNLVKTFDIQYTECTENVQKKRYHKSLRLKLDDLTQFTLDHNKLLMNGLGGCIEQTKYQILFIY